MNANPPHISTQVIWPGKLRDDGTPHPPPRVVCPLQVREVHGGFSRGGEGPNRLIWGDNLLALGALLETHEGEVDLLYIDPPFATGGRFLFSAPIGEAGAESTVGRRYSSEWAYDDVFGGSGRERYLTMMWDRLRLMHGLLAPGGSLFLHCDWHQGHLLRGLLDEIFGPDNFLNEIIWYYYNKLQGNVNHFARNHDQILWYRKGLPHRFQKLEEPRLGGPVKQLARVWDRDKQAMVNARGPDGKVLYRERSTRTVDDVWRLSMLQPADKKERCGYPTQKPKALLERVLAAASEPGDLVADLFCGSGTTLQVAEEMGRRWVGCDLGRWAIHLTRKRLLSLEGGRPFQIATFGAAQRRFWLLGPKRCVSMENGEERRQVGRARARYTGRICRLHGADEPGDGFQLQGPHLHARRGRAWVHVAPPDLHLAELPRVVSQAVDDCVMASSPQDMESEAKEAAKLQGAKDPRGHLCLHVLVPEWRPKILEPCVVEAEEKGVRLELFLVPEEALELGGGSEGSGEGCGEIRSRSGTGGGRKSPGARKSRRGDCQRGSCSVPFRPATISATVSRSGQHLQVSLTGYRPPEPEPEDHPAHEWVRTWSDYVDYWAVATRQKGSEGLEGPLAIHWWAYRTRSQRELPLESSPLTLPVASPPEAGAAGKDRSGPCEIEVCVVDVFGRESYCCHLVPRTVPFP